MPVPPYQGWVGRRVAAAASAAAAWDQAFTDPTKVSYTSALVARTLTNSDSIVRMNLVVPTHNWHVEVTCSHGAVNRIGLIDASTVAANYISQFANSMGYNSGGSGQVLVGPSGTYLANTGVGYTLNDIITIEGSGSSIYFFKNGVLSGGPYTISGAGPFYVAAELGGNTADYGSVTLNAGATAFTDTPTGGFTGYP